MLVGVIWALVVFPSFRVVAVILVVLGVNLPFLPVLDRQLHRSVLDVLFGANSLGAIRARTINSRAGSPSTNEVQR